MCNLSPISSLDALLLLHFHHHHQLTQRNYNQNIVSPSPLLFVACYDLNSTPPPPHIPTFHHPSLCMSRCVPSPHSIHKSTFQNQNQPAMIRSLACKVLFLTNQGPVPTCHHPFLSMSSSVPTCNFQNLRTTASILSRIFPLTIPSRARRSLHEIKCNRASVVCTSLNRRPSDPTPDHHHLFSIIFFWFSFIILISRIIVIKFSSSSSHIHFFPVPSLHRLTITSSGRKLTS